MSKYTTLTQFIEEQMEKFDIQDNEKNFFKLRQKFQRELKKLNIWEEANTKLIGRSKTRVFTKEQLSRLYIRVEAYLVKLSPIDKEKLESYRNQLESNKESFYNTDWNEFYKDENYPNIKVTKKMKQEFMLEAVFLKFFEPINTKQWEDDLELDSVVDDFDEEWAGSIEVFNARQRLENKISAYTKEKKQD